MGNSNRGNGDNQNNSSAVKVGSEGGVDSSRRQFLTDMKGAALTTALGVSLVSVTVAEEALAAPPVNGNPNQREAAATVMRDQANKASLTMPATAQARNADESLYADLRGNFFKTLPQNDFAEVDLTAHAAFKKALGSGLSADFAAITLAPGAVRKLVNPQAAYSFEMTGGDPQQSRIAPAPAFASATQAAEMGEVYWQALTRDVPCTDYGTHSLIAQAVSDLNGFSAKVGPTQSGSITPGTLFRGETPGDLNGPYISQFLLKPVPFGPAVFEQRYHAPVAGSSFMTTRPEFLAVQRGANPSTAAVFDTASFFIYNGRMLAEYVHSYFSFQAFMNAALIMLSYGPAALSPSNPYLALTNQAGFATLGGPDILDQVARAANIGLKTAWYQKWQVHRRLRPEVMAARIDSQRSNLRNY